MTNWALPIPARTVSFFLFFLFSFRAEGEGLILITRRRLDRSGPILRSPRANAIKRHRVFSFRSNLAFLPLETPRDLTPIGRVPSTSDVSRIRIPKEGEKSAWDGLIARGKCGKKLNDSARSVGQPIFECDGVSSTFRVRRAVDQLANLHASRL